jgi:hypothetical protein
MPPMFERARTIVNMMIPINSSPKMGKIHLCSHYRVSWLHSK